MKPGAKGDPSGFELLGLGALLAGALLVPLAIGLVLDAVLGASYFVFLGLLVGIVAAAAAVYTRFKRYL